jgi:hypothetical protein
MEQAIDSLLKTYGYPLEVRDHIQSFWHVQTTRELLVRNKILEGLQTFMPKWVSRINAVLPFWRYGLDEIWWVSPMCTPHQMEELLGTPSLSVFTAYGPDLTSSQERTLKAIMDQPMVGVQGHVKVIIGSKEVELPMTTYGEFIQALRTACLTVPTFPSDTKVPNVWLTYDNARLTLKWGKSFLD